MTTDHWRNTVALLALSALLPLGCVDVEETPDAAADTTAADTQAATVSTDTGTVIVADAGLQTPESVLHDDQADVYLVSNINGQPAEKDDNGFIARVRPDGTVEELRWIDGAADGVTLHAPKGLALHGDTLFVSDIDSVRAFHRTSGESLGARGVPGASFLNDLATDTDGTLYVSDTGVNPDFSPAGTDAVYRFDGMEAVAVAEGSELNGPNGIAVHDGTLTIVGFGGARILQLSTGQDSVPETLAELPGGQLDGIVRLQDGSFLVSSWETQSVYRVPGAGAGGATAVVEGVPSPADIGWDAGRGRLLIPVFQENRLEFRGIGVR